MLDFSDLSPFSDLSAEQARIVIDDVTAELDEIAPTLAASNDPSLLRILRAAALRYAAYLKSSARNTTSRQRVRGPFQTTDQFDKGSQVSGAEIFTDGEKAKILLLVDATATTAPAVALPVGSFPEPCPVFWP